MPQGAIGYDLEPGDEPDDEEEDDELEEGDDERDDENGDDEEEKPEDRRSTAPAPRAEPVRALEPTVTVSAPPSAPAPAAPDPARTSVGPQPRKTRVGAWLPVSDDRIDHLTVLDHQNRSIARLSRPLPQHPEHWVAATYGLGRYRLVQKDERGKHLGSRTVHVTDPAYRNGAPAPASSNGKAPAAVVPSSGQVYPGMDWRLALVTTGLPLIAAAMQSFAEAMAKRQNPSELDTLVKVAELLKVPNEERTALFRDGMKLAETIVSKSTSQDGEGSPFNWREILQGLGDLVNAFRQGQPAAGATPATPARPALASPPTPPAAAASAPAPNETAEQFVERVIFAEIQRAVGTADSPECLVILLDAWLPQVAAWIELSTDEQVLEELPRRYPAHAEFLAREPVQAFLKSALAMIREDAAAAGEEESGVHRPGPAPVS